MRFAHALQRRRPGWLPNPLIVLAAMLALLGIGSNLPLVQAAETIVVQQDTPVGTDLVLDNTLHLGTNAPSWLADTFDGSVFRTRTIASGMCMWGDLT